MKTKRSESGFINLGSPRAPPLSLPKAVASLHHSLVSWEMTSDTFSWASSFQTHSHGPSPGAGLDSRLAFLLFCLRDSFNVSCNMALSVMNPLDWSRASQIFILLSFLKDVFAPLSSRLHCFSHTHTKSMVFLTVVSLWIRCLFFLWFPYRLSLCHWCRTTWFSCSSWSFSSCFLCFGFIVSPICGFTVSYKSWTFLAIDFFKIFLFFFSDYN